VNNVPLLIAHVGGCPARGRGHSDEAKRISDATTLQWVAGKWDTVGRFMSFKLEDGRSDNTLYDSYRDAVRHAGHNEMLYMFVKLHPGGMNVCEAEAMLKFNRQAHSNGFRMPDPDHREGGHTLIPRIGMEKVQAQVRALGGR
jgi:hypothetical protein